MTELDPTRWLHDPSAPSAVRDALRAASSDGPSAAQLAALAAKLPGGMPPPPPPAAAATKPILAKLLVPTLAAAGVVAVMVATRAPEHEKTPVVVAVTSSPSIASEPSGAPSTFVPPTPSASSSSSTSSPSTTPPPIAAPREPEATILGQGQKALSAGDPAAALAAAERHRKLWRDGELAEEREVLAITALVRLGRRTEAENRADAFRTRWPASAYLRRIDVVLDHDASP